MIYRVSSVVSSLPERLDLLLQVVVTALLAVYDLLREQELYKTLGPFIGFIT